MFPVITHFYVYPIVDGVEQGDYIVLNKKYYFRNKREFRNTYRECSLEWITKFREANPLLSFRLDGAKYTYNGDQIYFKY